MTYEDDYYTLKSGRKVYSNGGIIGLGPDVTKGASEGYDGGFEGPFTREEREDIANEMIRRWTEWRDMEEPPPEEWM